MKIHKGDKVLIIKGRDRGKTGIVSAVDPNVNRIKIEGLNVVKRHMKKSGRGVGGIVDVTGSISASNVMLIDSATSKPTRVGYQTVGGKKVRITRLANTVIENVKS